MLSSTITTQVHTDTPFVGTATSGSNLSENIIMYGGNLDLGAEYTFGTNTKTLWIEESPTIKDTNKETSKSYKKYMYSKYISQIVRELTELQKNFNTSNKILRLKKTKSTLNELWEYIDTPSSDFATTLALLDNTFNAINWKNITEGKVKTLIEVLNKVSTDNIDMTAKNSNKYLNQLSNSGIEIFPTVEE